MKSIKMMNENHDIKERPFYLNQSFQSFQPKVIIISLNEPPKIVYWYSVTPIYCCTSFLAQLSNPLYSIFTILTTVCICV